MYQFSGSYAINSDMRDVYILSDKVPVFGLVRWESRQPYPEWVGGRTLIWELNDYDWEAPR